MLNKIFHHNVWMGVAMALTFGGTVSAQWGEDISYLVVSFLEWYFNKSFETKTVAALTRIISGLVMGVPALLYQIFRPNVKGPTGGSIDEKGA